MTLTLETILAAMRDAPKPPPLVLVSPHIGETLRLAGYEDGYRVSPWLALDMAVEVDPAVLRNSLVFVGIDYAKDYVPRRISPRERRRGMQRTGWWRRERAMRKRLRSARRGKR